MMAAEIGQRRAVDHGTLRGSEFAFENRMRIRPGHGVHGVETHREAGGEKRADRVEIEQRLHQRQILGDGVDDLDRRVLELDGAEAVDVEVRRVGNVVGVDLLGSRENRLGDRFRRRAARPDIVFDAEIAVRAARIVAGGEDDAAESAEMADEPRDRRRRQDAALADHDPAEAVGGGDLRHDLDRLAVEEAPVAADHQRLAVEAFERIEDRLDEILKISRLLEDGHFLAQTRSAGLLVGKRFCRDGFDHGRRLPFGARRS